MQELQVTVWRTLRTGGVGGDELLRQLDREGFHTEDWVKSLIAGITSSASPRVRSFVKTTARQLGFTGAKAPLGKIEERGLAEGFGLCEVEDLPYIRMGDRDQPLGGDHWYLMMMKPIPHGREQEPYGVKALHDGMGLWLKGISAFPEREIVVDRGIVFTTPEEAPPVFVW